MSSPTSSPSNKQQKKQNALEKLMNNSSSFGNFKKKSTTIKKRRLSSSSNTKSNISKINFVECPAGCGHHIPNLQHKINQHLDQQCSVIKAHETAQAKAAVSATTSTSTNVENYQKQVMEAPGNGRNLQSDVTSTTTSSSSSPVISTQQQETTPDNCRDDNVAAAATTTIMNPAVLTPLSSSSPKRIPYGTSQTSSQEEDASATATTTTATSALRSVISPDTTTTTTATKANADITNPSNHGNNVNRKNPYANKAKKSSGGGGGGGGDSTNNNAFATMMKNSHKAFMTKRTSTTKNNNTKVDVHQHFTLQYDANKDANNNINIVNNSTNSDINGDCFSWNLQIGTMEQHMWEPPLWFTTVHVKDKKIQQQQQQEEKNEQQQPKIVSLTLSATINPSASNMTTTTTNTTSSSYHHHHQQHHHRWVQYHSKLSIPVLKSMLQKSIRRRRPLPAVRVAMELMDKSIGEILRRLIVIIIEDSTLHFDIPILIWMMIAQSKGFFDDIDIDHTAAATATATAAATTTAASGSTISFQRLSMIQALKLRVLRIVYQIASCPYQDHLPMNIQDIHTDDSYPCISEPFPKKLSEDPLNIDKTAVVNNTSNLNTTSSSSSSLPSSFQSAAQLQYEHYEKQRHNLLICIWGLLVRAQYGGMSGDVRMLQLFAKLWYERLLKEDGGGKNGEEVAATTTSLSSTTKTSTLPKELLTKCTSLDWTNISNYIHANSTQQSLKRLPSSDLVLEKLCISDICMDGIDFHCSNVVDVILKDTVVVEAARTMLQKLIVNNNNMDESDILKRCIWKYSAGINLRRPLLTDDDESPGANGVVDKKNKSKEQKEEDARLKTLWTEVISPRVTNYQKKYLQDRLR